MSEFGIRPALEAGMKDVLERMFFLEASNTLTPDDGDEGPVIQARLQFAGEPSGWLRLRVTDSAARSMSADFLGMDEAAVDDIQAGEVVRELANIVCGSVLSRVGNSAAFRLGVPEIVHDTIGVDEQENAIVHSVETAIGVFTAILNTEGSACRKGGKSVF